METKLFDTAYEKEKVILIAIERDNQLFDAVSSLDELEALAETAGAICVGKMFQKRENIDRAHYFGKGKLEELRELIKETNADGVICDDELTSNQMKNMEEILNVKIMNRTLVILDIFALRAKSAEAKAQVELAQLKYKMSHLTGMGINMSRQGGGIGTRGPGEKKLETDRRNISDRIAELNKELVQIEKHRNILRQKRMKNKIPVVAFAGYTNAGKSTLMNKVSNAGVLQENKLFATVETTTRKIELPDKTQCLFTDTVGFIQKLPHNLIKAFRSTLEEVKYADIIIHVVDASNDSRQNQMKVVYDTLNELGCSGKPVITVFNNILISAKKNKGIDEMLETVEKIIKSFKKNIKVLIPYEKGNYLKIIFDDCDIINDEYKPEGRYFEIFASPENEGRLKEFII